MGTVSIAPVEEQRTSTAERTDELVETDTPWIALQGYGLWATFEKDE